MVLHLLISGSRRYSWAKKYTCFRIRSAPHCSTAAYHKFETIGRNMKWTVRNTKFLEVKDKQITSVIQRIYLKTIWHVLKSPSSIREKSQWEASNESANLHDSYCATMTVKLYIVSAYNSDILNLTFSAHFYRSMQILTPLVIVVWPFACFTFFEHDSHVWLDFSDSLQQYAVNTMISNQKMFVTNCQIMELSKAHRQVRQTLRTTLQTDFLDKLRQFIKKMCEIHCKLSGRYRFFKI